MNFSLALILRFIFRFSLKRKTGFLKIYNYYKNKGIDKSFIVKHQDGFLMKLDPKDWIQAQIFFIGTYEEFELKVMKSYLRNGGVFIDIGANIGLYSLTAAFLENVSVLAFEPFGLNYKLLQENINLNYLNNITLINKAIGESDRVSKLYYDEHESNLGMVSEFASPQYTTQQLVEFISLDNYLLEYQLYKIKYVKLDIEGGEYHALVGMKNTLSQYRPIVQIEINESIIELDTENDIFKLMDNYGYEIFHPIEMQTLKNSRNKFFRPKLNEDNNS